MNWFPSLSITTMSGSQSIKELDQLDITWEEDCTPSYESNLHRQPPTISQTQYLTQETYDAQYVFLVCRNSCIVAMAGNESSEKKKKDKMAPCNLKGGIEVQFRLFLEEEGFPSFIKQQQSIISLTSVKKLR